MHAAYAYRMAEFFLKADHPQKTAMYEKATECYYIAFDQLHIPYTVCEIPYKGTFLHAVRVGGATAGGAGCDGATASTTDRTLLVCGGYGSFMEEFIPATFDLVDEDFLVFSRAMGRARR